MFYDWLKALHVIAVIAWMAGLLYLPRLYVYHASAAPGSNQSETFKLMERRLLHMIVNPAMLASSVFGLWMLYYNPDFLHQPWMHAKIALLLGMFVFHAILARWRRDFAADRNRRTAGFYRVMNEVPTLLMIGIVVMVVVKPI